MDVRGGRRSAPRNNSGAAAQCSRRAGALRSVVQEPTELIYEATIPTVENPPQAAARLFEPQFEQERPGHFAQSPLRRAQTAHPGIRVK